MFVEPCYVSQTPSKHEYGYSLVELLTVLIITGILTAVAYPSYLEYVKKSRRSDAQGALMSLSASMARWYTQNDSSYTGAASGGNNTGAPAFFSATVPVDGGTAYYNLSITAAADSSYTIRATPTGKQTGDGYLELTSTGIKRWDENNNGSIESGESDWDSN